MSVADSYVSDFMASTIYISIYLSSYTCLSGYIRTHMQTYNRK